MTYRYTIFEQQLFEEHIGYYRTFGIEGCVRTDSGCHRLETVLPIQSLHGVVPAICFPPTSCP